MCDATAAAWICASARALIRAQSLTHLSLRNNKLSSLPPEIGLLSNLIVLDLMNNFLTALPTGPLPRADPRAARGPQWRPVRVRSRTLMGPASAEIGKCQKLESLTVDYNKIEQLPEEIGELTGLSSLGIRYNHLTQLPASLGRCTLLTDLNTEGNRLTTLQRELPEKLAPSLHSVRLSRNQITEFPTHLALATRLECLEIDHAGLSSLDESNFAAWPHLRRLDLEGNEIAAIPAAIGKLTALKELLLGSNCITKIPGAHAVHGMARCVPTAG